MNDLEIFDYIKVSKIQQKTQEEIYGELLAKGATIDRIQKQFENAAQNKVPAGTDSAVVKAESVLQTETKVHPEVSGMKELPKDEPKKVEVKSEDQSRSVKILVTIGALFIAIGIFYFIAANWQGFSSTAKIAIILLAMTVSYALGWLISEKTEYRVVGVSLIFLGTLIYGAAIFLVAQIFQIQANWPDGFVLWMLGTLAVALATEIPGIFVTSLILGIVAIFGYPWFILETFFRLPSGMYVTSTSLMVISTAVLYLIAAGMHKRLPSKEIY